MKKIITIISLIFSSLTFAQNDVDIIPDAHLKANSHHPTANVSADVNGLTTPFTKQDISSTTAVNLSEFLKQQQSVVRLTTASSNPTQTALSIRGFGDNAAANSLILVDGFPLTNPSLLTPNLNSIPLSDIERIDIFQGSEGTLWGNQAVGGVVNIVTKHPQKFFASTYLTLGSYYTTYFNVFAENKVDDFFIKGFGLLGQTQHYRDHSHESDNNMATTLGYDYASGLISFNLQTYSATSEFPGGLTAQQFKNHPQMASNFKNFSYYRVLVLQLLNKHEINDNLILESRFAHQELTGNGFVNFDFTRHDGATTLEERLLTQSDSNKMTVGLFAQTDTYHFANTKIHEQVSTKQFDVFAQDVYSLWPQVNLTLGARRAWQEKSGSVFVTELGFNYRYTDQLAFYLRRDGNFSFPKADEQTWLPTGISTLQPQVGFSYEGGLAYNTDNQSLQFGLYQLALHNEIAFNPAQTDTQPFGAYNNLDPTIRNGATLSEKYRVTQQLSVNTQLNYVAAKFVSGTYKGNWVPAVPAFNSNLGVTYDLTEQWQLNYDLLYTGSRFASDDVANSGGRLPGYFLHNITLQYALKNGLVGLEINNIANTHYPAYAFYNAFDASTTFYPAAGRNFLLTAKLNFD